MPKVDIDSFKLHDELHPDIWDGMKMRPEIRQRLLKVALDYVESLGMDAVPLDITLTGSLANFNYSKYSDFDVHPIFDYALIDENEQLVRELMLAKKSVWNRNNDIKIKGFEIEMYSQDIGDPHHSTGVYSLTNGKWIVPPSKKKLAIDLAGVKEKAQDMMDLIDHAIATDCDSDCLKAYREKLRRMRQSGLESGGEFSIENLAFKALRRNGSIGKLMDEMQARKDQELSLESEE